MVNSDKDAELSVGSEQPFPSFDISLEQVEDQVKPQNQDRSPSNSSEHASLDTPKHSPVGLEFRVPEYNKEPSVTPEKGALVKEENEEIQNEKENHENNGAIYQCTLCSYSCSSMYMLGAHMNTPHYDMKCRDCDFTSNSITTIQDHFYQEHGDISDAQEIPSKLKPKDGSITEKCEQCDQDFASKDELWQHTKEFHLEDKKMYDCPKCSFSSEYKHHLDYHLQDHYYQEQGELGDIQMSESPDKSKMPELKADGKIKMQKCKHCNQEFTTKTELWQHSKDFHINPKKLLACPKCNFGTEYKHHLDYHMNAYHFKLKAFKCAMCDYKCVCKSMLNSHMKSHSEVFRYRCYDCEYKTKYHHSLKQHLQKFQHKQDIILNPDGSPNPYQFIDIYGRRRGPRLKQTGLSNGLPYMGHNQPSFPVSFQNPSPHMRFSKQDECGENERIQPPTQKGVLTCTMCGFMAQSRNEYVEHYKFHEESLNRLQPEQTSPKIESSNSEKHFDNTEKEKLPLFHSPDNGFQQFLPNPKRENQLRQIPYHHNGLPPMGHPTQFFQSPYNLPAYWSSLRQYLMGSNPSGNLIPNPAPTQPPKQVNLESRRVPDISPPPTPQGPLDLRKEKPRHNFQDTREISSYPLDCEKPKSPESPDRSLKVSKLEKALTKLQQQKSSKPEDKKDMEISISMMEKDTQKDPQPTSHTCHYCDITFMEATMYQLHMGFHTHGQPFKCNICGVECKDRLGFFLHMARSSHLKQ